MADLKRVTVEVPYHDPIDMDWEEAKSRYALDEADKDTILSGEIVWYKDVAISLPEEDE